jgi:hypothetical protein
MRVAKTMVASVTGLFLLAGLGGCAAKHVEVIPATARLQMSSSGDKVYTAPSDGTVYVYDKAGDRLIWSGQVRAGQIVGVAPAQNQVTLNGAPVSSRMQVGNGQIDLLFEPAPNAQPAGVTLDRSRTLSGTSTMTEGTTVTSPGSFTVQPPPVTVTPSVRVEQAPTGGTVTPVPSADPGK